MHNTFQTSHFTALECRVREVKSLFHSPKECSLLLELPIIPDPQSHVPHRIYSFLPQNLECAEIYSAVKLININK